MIDKETEEDRRIEIPAYFYLLIVVLFGTFCALVCAAWGGVVLAAYLGYDDLRWPALIVFGAIGAVAYFKIALGFTLFFPRFNKSVLRLWHSQDDSPESPFSHYP